MFRFKLQSVLGLKENIEDVKKRELGLANVQKELLEQEKQVVILKETKNRDLFSKAQQQQIDLQLIKEVRQYNNVLTVQKKDLEGKIEIAKEKVEEKRQALIEAMKEKKILTNLKEIKREEYFKELRKIEEKQVDELVSYKYTTKGEGEK